MPTYTKIEGKLTPIKEETFKLEKDIQTLFETNLETVLNLQLVRSEFSIKGRRIDTLAYNPKTNSFVIIEYKRGQSISVFDQGITYLGLMLENKADFILEFNESCDQTLERKSVDWSQSKVIFVSTKFSEFQKSAANFKGFAIELWQVKQFENDTVTIKEITKPTRRENANPILERNRNFKTIQKEMNGFGGKCQLDTPPMGEEMQHYMEGLKKDSWLFLKM